MKKLTQSNLFTLLVSPPKNDSLTKLNQAYDEFVEYVFCTVEANTDTVRLYYRLSYARIELENLQSQTNSDESKKKCQCQSYFYVKNTFASS